MKILGKILFVVVVNLCIFGSAGADSAYRCGTELVSLGDTRYEVRQKCGDPTSVESWEEERIQRDFETVWRRDPRTDRYEWYREPFLVKVQVRIELWIYSLRSYQFNRYLKFENGVLKEIKSGGG